MTSLPRGTELITNERAYFDPHHPGVHFSPDWEVTSGSLFSINGTEWTGVPDGISPNADSSNGTDSAVFRAVTRRDDFENVAVSFQLRISKLVSTERTPSQSYDGVHVFLRYQNQRYLYVASVYRRDGSVVIKKKVPGGPSPANGGTYSTLAQSRFKMAMDIWVPVVVSINTLTNRSVSINMDIEGRPVLSAIDRGTGGAPILGPGRVGLRGDNCEFFFRGFTAGPAKS